MTTLRSYLPAIQSVALGGLIAALWLGATMVPVGQREISSPENIYGVPYPVAGDRIQISEQLAHADLYLREPVIGKAATITITFIPHDVETLALGIRENEFWLSYPLTVFYEQHAETNTTEPITRTVNIPLTDKLADRDGSVDVMLFANATSATIPGPPVADTTVWELRDIEASVVHDLPSRGQLRNALSSILHRERPL